MSGIRPLPRSLDPLPDESLPGYLLRLAHRLDRKPMRIMALTLLAANRTRQPCRISHEFMVKLDAPTRNAFAAATRLTPREVDDLCLSSFAPRYPLPPQSSKAQRYGQQATQRTWWLLTSATRFCPSCLAGDGSAIQQAHGGAWRRSWRLPIVFACLEHRQLLRHLCPTCERPAHGSAATGERIPLIAGPRIGALHPAQCRWAPSDMLSSATPDCGARLDMTTTTATASATVLALQRRLIEILQADKPSSVISAGEQTTAVRYFTDLRLLTHLVWMSWPRARHLAPSPDLADAIDRQHTHVAAERSPATLLTQWRPLDPAPAAGLLAIAEHILTRENPRAVREYLQELLPPGVFQTNQTGWAAHFAADDAECSQGLHKAAAPLVKRFSRRARRSGRAAELQTRFGPEHVPQRLPDHLFDQHLSHLDEISPALLRRAGSIRLLQLAFGSSLGNAAHHLGFPTTTGFQQQPTYAPGAEINRWARNRNNPFEFDTAVAGIAAELDRSTDLVNYGHRRRALTTWSITPDTWQNIVERAAPRRTFLLADRHRHAASTLVWAQVTCGERRYAPTPIKDQQTADIQPKWRYHHPWTLLNHAPPGYLAALLEALDTVAEQLINHIDQELPRASDS